MVGFAGFAAGQHDGSELEGLFVDPGRRRRGVARHLVQQIVNVVRKSGDRRLRVTGKLHALAFYLTVGLVRVEDVSTELGTGLRAST